MATRIFFRDNEILIDTIPTPFIAASLYATLNGAQVDITRYGSDFVFASPAWTDVADASGNTFATPDAVMAYLASQFTMRRPVGAIATALAGTDLGGHKALMFDPAGSGSVVYADPDAEDYAFAGLSLTSAASGSLINTITAGLVSEPSWQWDPLQPVYVGESGALTQTAPASGLFHLLGFAATATSLLLAPAPLVYLA